MDICHRRPSWSSCIDCEILVAKAQSWFLPMIVGFRMFSSCCLRIRPIRVRSVELVSRDSEFVNHDIAKLLQIIESFHEHVFCRHFVFAEMSVPAPACDDGHAAYPMSVFVCSLPLLRDAVWSSRRTQHQDCRGLLAIDEEMSEMSGTRSLLHDDISQRIAQSVVFVIKRKRSCCLCGTR